MNDVLKRFLEEEVTEMIYNELWDFISSASIVTGTFECSNHVVVKMSSTQLLIYPIYLGLENIKFQNAVLIAKSYLLRKINSKAYERKIPDIRKSIV